MKNGHEAALSYDNWFAQHTNDRQEHANARSGRFQGYEPIPAHGVLASLSERLDRPSFTASQAEREAHDPSASAVRTVLEASEAINVPAFELELDGWAAAAPIEYEEYRL